MRAVRGARRDGESGGPIVTAGLAIATAAYLLWSTEGVSLPAPLPAGLSYRAAWIAVAALVAAVITVRSRRLRPIDLLAAVAIAAFVVSAAHESGARPMRDLELYLRAAERFVRGEVVYLATPIAVPPADQADLPFLYPPVTLPLFAALAALPPAAAVAAWGAGSLAAAVIGLRLIGVSWRWTVLLLLSPPFFHGLWAGNVAPLAFALFAAGPRLAAALPLSAVFKLYNGLTALWLVRERRWGAIAGATAIVAGAVSLSLPITGVARWAEWLDGLGHYQTSQGVVPDLLGMALPHFLPAPVALALAVAFLLAALAVGGRDSLARLGLATVVASPSLFTHGFLFALPAFLGLQVPWALAALGVVGGPAQGAAWWIPVAVVVASWTIASLRRSGSGGEVDPLAGADGPWPRRSA
jgi:hypothetical protein